MKNIALLCILLFSLLSWTETNANDYPITVHVTSAQVTVFGVSTGYGFQRLHVVINGKKYVLEAAESGHTLLALGDYKAKLVEDRHRSPYESSQTYELLLPDKKTKQFLVTGHSE